MSFYSSKVFSSLKAKSLPSGWELQNLSFEMFELIPPKQMPIKFQVLESSSFVVFRASIWICQAQLLYIIREYPPINSHFSIDLEVMLDIDEVQCELFVNILQLLHLILLYITILIVLIPFLLLSPPLPLPSLSLLLSILQLLRTLIYIQWSPILLLIQISLTLDSFLLLLLLLHLLFVKGIFFGEEQFILKVFFIRLTAIVLHHICMIHLLFLLLLIISLMQTYLNQILVILLRWGVWWT